MSTFRSKKAPVFPSNAWAAAIAVGSMIVPVSGNNESPPTVNSTEIATVPQCEQVETDVNKDKSWIEVLNNHLQVTYGFPIDTEKIAEINKLLLPQLFKDPSDKAILLSFVYGTDQTKELAWKILNERPQIDNSMLRQVIGSSEELYTLYAVDMLMRQDPQKIDLYKILDSGYDQKYKDQILHLLLEKDPDISDLIYVWRNGPPELSEDITQELILHVDELGEHTLELLLLKHHKKFSKKIIKTLATVYLNKILLTWSIIQMLPIVDDREFEKVAVKKLFENKYNSADSLAYMFASVKDKELKETIWKRLEGLSVYDKMFLSEKLSWMENKEDRKRLSDLVLSTNEALDYSLYSFYKLKDPDLSNEVSKIALGKDRIKNPSNLVNILEHASPKYQKMAAEKVLAGFLPKGLAGKISLLQMIIDKLPEFEKRATKLIFKAIESTSNPEELVKAINSEPSNKANKRICEKLFAFGRVSKDNLITIAQNVHPQYRTATYYLLLSHSDLKYDDIIKVIDFAPPAYQIKLANKVFESNPGNDGLLFAWNYDPSLRDKILKKVEPPGENWHYGFGSFLMITSNNQEQQAALVAKLKDHEMEKVRIPYLRMDVWEPSNFNERILPVALRDVPYEERDDFVRIYTSTTIREYFKANKNLTYAETFSIGLALVRFIKANMEGKIDDSNLQYAINYISSQREKFKKLQILGADTTLIHFTHDEFNSALNRPRFDNKHTIDLAKSAGVKKIVDENMKGPAYKDRILQAIKDSQGPTTIWWNGHGGKQEWGLSRDSAFIEKQEDDGNPLSISFRELGNALLESDNISNIIIVGCTCFGYDFMKNLESYIRMHQLTKGVPVQMPTLITAANKNSQAFSGAAFTERSMGNIIFNTGSVFLDAVVHAHEKGTPLTGADMLEVDSMVHNREDPSYHMPDEDSGELIELSYNSVFHDQSELFPSNTNEVTNRIS